MAKDMRTISRILKMDGFLCRIERYGKDITKDARTMAEKVHYMVSGELVEIK